MNLVQHSKSTDDAMDALSEVLRLVRLKGAVFLHAEFSAPWAAHSPPSTSLVQALLPEAEHMIEYHLILEGRCFVQVEDEEPVELEAGDLVMMPRGDAHLMCSELGLRPETSDMQFLRRGEIVPLRFGGGGDLTRLACGYLAIDRRVCGSLLQALPRVLRVKTTGQEVSGWVQSYLRMQIIERASEQPGGACVLDKLSELMFVEAIRRYADSLPPHQSGWLAGLKDPCVGKALGLLHGSPTQAWTVDELARQAGVSRSGLAERFTTLIGKSPMQYLTHWRLTLAAHLLRTTARPASSIAREVGYEAEGAFNKAFKREFGAPPAAWRKKAAAARADAAPAQQARAGAWPMTTLGA